MKRVSTTFAFVLGAFMTFSSAAQIQGFISGYAPGNVEELKKAKGVETSQDLHSDFMWGLGAEFLANPVGPLVVGGGLGFFSLQQDGDVNVVMPSIPLWASVGVIGPEQWTARPYLEVRVGYPIPATGLSTWWDKPQDFFVTGTIGVQLPYHMGVEFDCTYLTMDKYFSDYDVNFRLSSVKIGGSITVHFDLGGGSAEPSKAPEKKNEFVAQPAAEFSSEETSSGVNEDSESAASEETSYSDYSEQPAEESVTEESTAEPMTEYAAEETSEEQPAEETAESTAEEEYASAPATDETSADAAPEEEAAGEESVVEEVPAEEPAAEPAPEPKPEPAAAKKDSGKKSAKNAQTKKGSKKSTKKTSAKKSTKKGKATSKKTTKKPAAKKKAAAKKQPQT